MSKQEILSFKNRYITYLKNNNGNCNICEWLENAIDFESPDGYYFDENSRLLVIFEHFEIDCSERPVNEKGKSLGSTRSKNFVDKHKEVQKEIQESDCDYYESTKVVEQGYYKQDGNNRIYELGKNGDKYRDNFIKNFYESFETNWKKIEKYKNNVIEKLGIQPLEFKVCFLVEDKTNGGTHYLENGIPSDKPVILTDALQFQEKINNSKVDLVIYGQSDNNGIIGVGYKGDSVLNKIDLMKKEFFVLPSLPLFTFSKKTIINRK